MKNRKGFTLIELLVVVGIIGLLATLSFISYRGMRTRARIATAQHYIDQLDRVIAQMSLETELWPGGQEMEVCAAPCADNEICGDGCTYSLSDPESGLTSTDGSFSYWHGPYVDVILLDPWGNEYFFDTGPPILPYGSACLQKFS